MLPEGSLRADRVWKRFRAEKSPRNVRGRVQQMVDPTRRRRARDYRWALRDVSFHAQPGESIGLVGRNGSGKSTLLKILNRVMYPYAGSVQAVGRVGALIEVRAGIHPELTGRENVQLYGSLLGLSRRDVQARFDDIIDFAEISEAVDRQVKFYSSGMQMRLGFAVAAFLEPNVLLVDEVLAVGDASFQQKCLDRMRLVLSQGTTLVFVSHDLAPIESTCSRVLWLEDGLLRADGEAHEVLGGYRRSVEQLAELDLSSDGEVRLLKAEVDRTDGGRPATDEPLEVRLRLEGMADGEGTVVIGISEGPATPVLVASRTLGFHAGETIDIACEFERLPLPRGRYFMWVGVFRNNRDLLKWRPCAQFDVLGPKLDMTPKAIVRLAPVATTTHWNTD